MSEHKSILAQAEQIVSSQPDGVRGGLILDGKDIGAEVSAKLDVGKPGGWKLATIARVTKGKDKFAAILASWTGK
jgi:hypothetical protein